jgi:hypothetical protein
MDYYRRAVDSDIAAMTAFANLARLDAAKKPKKP